MGHNLTGGECEGAKEVELADDSEQLPVLAATKTTLRFQDNVEALAQSSGQAGSAKETFP